MKFINPLVVGIILLTTSLFAVSSQTGSKVIARSHSESLTGKYAAFRKQQVNDISYQLFFQFDKTHTSFNGKTVIKASIDKSTNAPITIDFELGDIESITINNKNVTWDFSKWYITIKPEYFNLGMNEIVIKYQRPYSTDGSGLHRFVDPEDGEVYLYSDFEPYDANRLFPHFDQPDLKASFSSTVTAPKDWQIISTTRETNIVSQGNMKTWHFPASKKISSYVFAMHAGPYQQWSDKFESIPLRLFARKSIAKYVKPNDWFTPTKQSFAFFNKYFDFYYPFGKYDQIMAPDFNSGAMENVAAVTFNEAYVSRGEKSIAKKRSLANTISHEMAHMWFGDLVTMKWWNGLWLNESFATYMANLALSKASDFDNIWDDFYSGTKQWAYFADQSVNTHAIELPVNNTADAFSNFDGITYGKGASVLKQIPYFLGEENFRQGVANYLKKYAYSNTSLADFIGELGKAANKDLSLWTKQWLYHAGVNTIKADYQCKNGKITAFSILQTAPKQHPTLRMQTVQLGLYQLSNNKLLLNKAIPVEYHGSKTSVKEALGLSCPDLVYPNNNDWGFAKVALDEKSMVTLKNHINDIENTTLRLMLWQSLWDSMRDAKLPINQYINFALANAGAEKSNTIVNKIAGHLTRANRYLIAVNNKKANQYRADITEFAYQQLTKATAGSEQQKIWYSNFVRLASTPKHLAIIRNILLGETQFKKLVIDQDKRWALVSKLNQHLYQDYQSVLTNEMKRDPSDSGVKSAIVAEVVRPIPEIKAKWFNVILNNPDKLKLSTLRRIMSNIFPLSQSSLMTPYSNKILAAIPTLNDTASLGYLRAFGSSLVPATCTKSSVEQLTKAVTEFSGLKPQIIKSYKGSLQEDKRCLAIKNLAFTH